MTTVTTEKERIAIRNTLKKLLGRKDGVSVREASGKVKLTRRTVRKYFRALNAKPTDYIGYYKC